MIQHTYDVQTFDDGNKIIRPALSNEYEALLGCLIDFPDLMERSEDIVIGGEAEIYNTAGNTIRETYRGRFSDSDETTFIFLNNTLKTKVRTDIPGITYMEVNDPHYWNAEYDDKENRLCLAW